MWPELFAPHQIGSYNEPVSPPMVEPADGPLVCVSFNKDWLPYVLGSLMQLVNPSSWLVADDAALELVLERSTALLDIFGQAGDCMTYSMRFTEDCQLQFSVDGEETWTAVSGWVEGFATCFPPQTQVRLNANCNLQESFDGGSTWPNVPGWAANFRDCTRLEVGPPPPQPFPPTLPPADQACAIATHLVQAIIRGSTQQAVTSINATDSILTFGVALLGLVPGVDLVLAGVLGGGAALYEYINAGRIAAFNTAVADDAYFDDMRCRVQDAIATTGYITPENWPTVLAAVGSTPYSDSDVVFATAEFAAALGFSGANELQQIGTLTTGDCSSCGEWCYQWGEGGQTLNINWAALLLRGTFDGTRWNSVFQVDGQYLYLGLVIDPPVPITSIHANTTYAGFPSDFIRAYASTTFTGTALIDVNSTIWDGGPLTIGSILVSAVDVSATFQIARITLKGPGSDSSPFGDDNCTA